MYFSLSALVVLGSIDVIDPEPEFEPEFEFEHVFEPDLHLHTIASKCFQDETVTPEQWVDRAIEQGLNCVAITDHNTGTNVDAIKDAARGKNLTVFPGVEITCDTAKVHLLILFDVTKTSPVLKPVPA